MANFFVSLTNEEIAKQIADLINKHNCLYVKHNGFTIASRTTDYFVEIFGNEVVGCASITKENNNWSIIKYVCVKPEFRRKGIANKLVNLSVQNCKTKYVYMTIREDNVASLRMANKLEFTIMKQEWSRNHYLIVVGRKVKHGTSSYNSRKY
jgi:ribosomal protein S18 acetylase RimI-like enzyme